MTGHYIWLLRRRRYRRGRPVVGAERRRRQIGLVAERRFGIVAPPVADRDRLGDLRVLDDDRRAVDVRVGRLPGAVGARDQEPPGRRAVGGGQAPGHVREADLDRRAVANRRRERRAGGDDVAAVHHLQGRQGEPPADLALLARV